MKGVSSIVIVITLTLIVVSAAGAFLVWINNSSDTLESAVEEKDKELGSRENTEFFISEVDSSNGRIIVENSGRTKIDTDDFEFYLNDSQTSASPDVSQVDPGDNVVFTMPADLSALNNYNIVLIGPGNTRDLVYMESP